MCWELVQVRFCQTKAPPLCPAGVDCFSVMDSHYARYDHTLLARHRDLGLINLTTRDISPMQLSDKLSPKISETISTTYTVRMLWRSMRVLRRRIFALLQLWEGWTRRLLTCGQSSKEGSCPERFQGKSGVRRVACPSTCWKGIKRIENWVYFTRSDFDEDLQD